jgi:Tol biopolymer transport system component
MSLDSSNIQGDGASYNSSISYDGRYVAFDSSATNLVAADTNGVQDVFVRDTQTDTIIRVSMDSSGVEGDLDSFSPSISYDGRFVAFYSNSTNLVAADTNDRADVFVYDTQTDTTIRVSVDSSGVEGESGSYNPSISADGRYVAFYSNATNLVASDTNVHADIFVRDTQSNTTTRVSVDSGALESNGNSYNPSISYDGRYVTFDSNATNLVAADTNVRADIFLRDTQSNTTIRVSVDSSGLEGNSDSFAPSISADGRYVAFESNGTNLVAADTNVRGDIFVHDTQSNTTTRVSVDSSGVEGDNGSYNPSISADGAYVAFESDATNFVINDTNGLSDIFRAPND